MRVLLNYDVMPVRRDTSKMWFPDISLPRSVQHLSDILSQNSFYVKNHSNDIFKGTHSFVCE